MMLAALMICFVADLVPAPASTTAYQHCYAEFVPQTAVETPAEIKAREEEMARRKAAGNG